MIHWNNFDHIYCIHYKPHVERWNGLCKEFERIGLINQPNFEFWYTDKERRNNVETVSQKHIDVYHDAISKGYDHILVMENDVRFHNNLEYIEKYINDFLPNKYDLILFDYVYGYWQKELERIVEYRKEFNKELINIGLDSNVWSCGCYALSQRMMSHIEQNQNVMTCGPDYYITYKIESIDQEYDKSMLRYVPYYNVAVQKTYYSNLRTKIRGSDNTYQRYAIQGIDINDYNIKI